MTALQVAQHLHAKKTGKTKWIALCPAHPDRKPSLSICEGRKGVLLRCMSMGCDTRDVVRAAGLTMEGLFFDSGQKRDEKAYVEMQRRQEAQAIADKKQWEAVRFWTDETRRWETIAALLHAHLVQARGTPDEHAISRLWRKALATARARHEKLREFWADAPEVRSYYLIRMPKEITRRLTGPEIADVLGL